MSFGEIEFYDDQNAPKSLYIGHLHPKVSEELLSELFSKYGDINSCKVFPETPGQDPYAFVEYKKREDADHARAAMNDRRIFDKNIIVRFATNKTNQKRDLSNDYHIFVGDLSPEIQPTDLAKAFQAYGKLTSVRIMKDNNTGKSKGFAFLSFSNKEEAEKAIEEMNNQFIGSRQIRTNWASRKGPGDGENAASARGAGFKQISYSEALSSSTPTNTTVYFGNLPEQATDSDLRELVGEHGNVVDVKLFADKRYAFVRMSSHEEAAMCICKLHGNALKETYIKCFWGKEYNPNSNSQSQGKPPNANFNNSNNQQQAYGGSGGQNQNYSQYVQNYWNQYYQQYYQYMDPTQQQYSGQQQQYPTGPPGGTQQYPPTGPPGGADQQYPPSGPPAVGPQFHPPGPPGGADQQFPPSGPSPGGQQFPPSGNPRWGDQQYSSSGSDQQYGGNHTPQDNSQYSSQDQQSGPPQQNQGEVSHGKGHHEAPSGSHDAGSWDNSQYTAPSKQYDNKSNSRSQFQQGDSNNQYGNGAS